MFFRRSIGRYIFLYNIKVAIFCILSIQGKISMKITWRRSDGNKRVVLASGQLLRRRTTRAALDVGSSAAPQPLTLRQPAVKRYSKGTVQRNHCFWHNVTQVVIYQVNVTHFQISSTLPRKHSSWYHPWYLILRLQLC